MDNVDFRRSHVVLAGDFNATSPLWLSSDSYNTAGRLLEPVFLQQGLSQCVDFPTHLGNDGTLRYLLYLALVSNPSLHVGT